MNFGQYVSAVDYFLNRVLPLPARMPWTMLQSHNEYLLTKGDFLIADGNHDIAKIKSFPYIYNEDHT